MDLFTYLMAKNGHNTSIHEDLFSYLLGKAQGGGGEIKTSTGITINIPNAKKLVNFIMTKESTQETTTGKNLYDKLTNYLLNNGSNRVQTYDYLFLVAGTYTISYTGASLFYIIWYDSNYTKIGESDWTTGAYTFTLSDNYYIKVIFKKSDNSAISPSDITNIQIESGSIATSYEEYTGGQPSPNPDYPQEVKTVKGYRNLFDKDGYLSTGKRISTSTGGLYNATNYTTTTYIDVIENNNYSLTTGISSYFCWYDENKDKISAGTWTTSGGYKRAPENSKYIRFDFLTENINNIQFTESIQELPYVPYGNNYVNVAVSDGTNTNNYPIPLNNNEIVGIGDYKDELKVDKSGHVFINKKTGKVVFNGSESGWTYDGASNYPIRINVTNAIFTTSYNIPPLVLCNYYKPFQWNIGSNKPNYGVTATENSNRIVFRNVDITSLANWKTWLSTHNTELYYVLETPETIDLQTTVDLSLFKGVNNVSNSEDGYMTIEYVSENEEA